MRYSWSSSMSFKYLIMRLSTPGPMGVVSPMPPPEDAVFSFAEAFSTPGMLDGVCLPEFC